MIIEVDARDPTPVYEQIRAQVGLMVAAGTLPPGTRLPTIRQLAADLALAKGTVAKAYEVLLRDGVVSSAGRNGTVVAEPELLDLEARAAQLDEAAQAFALRALQLGVAREAAEAAVQHALDQPDREPSSPNG